jgi:dTDP-4-amino-4,6-dideoxygalactose transaminase
VNGHIEKPDSNVSIMFCSIECGRQESIATAPAEASFRRDMEDWAALCGIENELSNPDNSQFSNLNSQLYASNRLSSTVLSLPMHPYLEASDIEFVSSTLISLL